MMKKDREEKIRLDQLLVERGLVASRERAKALILAGVVLVAGKVIDKAGTQIPAQAEISLKSDDNPYVSRGGLKLKGALTEFNVDVAGLTALDVGASTGGFSDCLLQEGARKVYAVDVGYGQLAWSLRQDSRVTLFERTNIRYFDGREISAEIDIAVIDVSFISLRLVLPVVARLLCDGGGILALIKPQFEAGREEVGKKGVVRDPRIHKKVVDEIAAFAQALGLEVIGICDSPLMGPAGNKEFFLYARKH